MPQNGGKPKAHLQIGIATVGSSHDPICKGYRHTNADRQFLLCDDKMLEVAKEAKKRIEGINGANMCEIIKINPFDFQDILMKIIGIKKTAEADAEISVNITGGTNIMASAALVACFTIGADAFYLKKGEPGSQLPLEASIIEIPVPKIPLDSLTKPQRKLLKSIYDRGGKVNKVTTTLSIDMNKKKGTITSLLKKLKKNGLVILEVSGREKVVALTNAGKLFAQLLS